jgi:hypothetical protein
MLALLLRPVAALLMAALAVAPNHHFLQYQDGCPFFWLGDTAWLLLSKLDRADTARYLDDRHRKGFNVLQVMVLHGSNEQTIGGVPALIDGKPEKPYIDTKPGEYGYWQHLDWVVDQAAQRDMFLALVPAWGSLVKKRQLNAGNAVAYATFLARRYRDNPNVIWINGGDIDGGDASAVWKQLGTTLKKEDPGHLITFHPFGRTQSSTWFHNEPWLDFNMFQSGHQRYSQDTKSPHRFGEDNWRYVQDDYARRPVKPVLDGEPSYENIPQGLHDPSEPYWTASDARRYAYWSVFAGAFGHTYGDNSIMQFHRPSDGQGAYGARNYWYEAINDPGSGQIQFLKRLMLSRPFFDRVPDQSAIAGKNGTRYEYVIATRGTDYLFAYTYTGKPFEIRMGVISGERVKAWWYSPRDGSSQVIGEFPNTGTRQFTPPAPGGTPAPGNDWVLVLDDAGKNFGAPG